MLWNTKRISAEFGKCQDTAGFWHRQAQKIIMETVDIPTALIEPSAGRIHQAGRIQSVDKIRDLAGRKLSPSLIKGNPGDNGRVVIK